MRRFSRLSKGIKELARHLAAEQGIEPLKRVEERPLGYYTTNSWTGTNGYPRGAVVRKKPDSEESEQNPIKRPRGISQALFDLGRWMAKAQGIEMLKDGWERPDGYYTVNHFTEKSGFKPGAMVPKKMMIDEPLWRPRLLAKYRRIVEPGLSLDVRDGWSDIVSEMFAALATAHFAEPDANWRIATVKEKFGELRVVGVPRRFEAARQAVSAAHAASLRVCDICGAPGSVRNDGPIRVRCDTHAQYSPAWGVVE